MAKILLIVYDNGSHIPFFPQSTFYLLQALRSHGEHLVGVWHQDMHHGEAKYLTEILDTNAFDIVGLGFVAGYYQYKIAKQLAEAVNASKRRKEINFVLGGHGPGAEPDYFMRVLSADTVVVGDGEKAICDIASGNLKGIIQGEPATADDINLGVYADMSVDYYKMIRWPTSKPTDFCFPILSSRGCKWSCSFCYRMRKGFHERSVDSIMDEIRYLHTNHAINHFQFSDELLMSSKARTEEICQAIQRLPFKIKWDCNGRLNYAQPTLLTMMRQTGCEYVNYGIESLNQDMLNQMGKGLTVAQITKGVEATLKAKISPGLNLIWGFPGDTPQNLTLAVDFLKKYDPCHELRTVRPVTPYPGTKLYQKAINDGLLEGPEDFYERKHVNSDLIAVNFMDISTKEAHKCLMNANRQLYYNYLNKRQDEFIESTRRLYTENDTSFRGFREV